MPSWQPWSQGDAVDGPCNDKRFSSCSTGCHSHETTQPIHPQCPGPLFCNPCEASWLLLENRIETRVGCFFAFTGEPDRHGGSSVSSLWGRGAAAGRGGPFLLDACFFPLPRPLSVMFIHTQIDWWRRLPAFYTVYTKWRHDSVTIVPTYRRGSLLNRFAH